MMRFPMTLLLTVSIAACGREAEPPDTDRAPAPASAWVTIEGVEFPAAMAGAPSPVLEAYVFAVHHPEVLRYMPCYCGCENIASPHGSNYDCFVDAIDRTGPTPRVFIDTMGFS